jgi:5-methyltetrahydropteroyltriglutamate--homocysteine methyltransferase
MLTNNLGYPRIGSQRELKKACESYWAGESSLRNLQNTAKDIRRTNWQLQQAAGIDLIPCNDFSYYDQVLDMCLTVSAIPERFHPLAEEKQLCETDLLFAMARGYQKDGYDIKAMEMTKWFDTNYHYIVPEFRANQQFNLLSDKIIDECREALQLGIQPKPVLIGPVSFLLSGKEKEAGFHRISLLKNLLPVYKKIVQQLEELNIRTIQFDEPYLSLDLSDTERKAITTAYQEISKQAPRMSILLASYFECYGNNLATVLQLPVQTIHLDLVRCPSQLDDILATDFVKSDKKLSLGVVDGRNIWKNDFEHSLLLINKAVQALGENRVLVAPSCSLLHVPCDLALETTLPDDIKNWLSFAKQKIGEVVALKQLATGAPDAAALLDENQKAVASRRNSPLIHKPHVKQRTAAITAADAERNSTFESRRKQQQALLKLPLFPTTTIGSFPQTADIRQLRANLKKGKITQVQYDEAVKEATQNCVRLQEELGLDVLVHGEFERNDMVEYFGELLEGYAFTKNGWVQSYGSRCVKPPVVFGDVERKAPMTVAWTSYAQSLTKKHMKGMLTGPVTILQWSFVRDDQPRETTTMQIALAIRDEVSDLEAAGIKVIQIDEPAIREGLPLRKENWPAYLEWAVKAFKVSSCSVADSTQIHTHMCYSEFNDIIDSIAAMDADVITIETSRSQMELLDAFADFKYPNEIGPGVYDIHSPRVPTVEEMEQLLQKAAAVIPVEHLWVNPDCGLKTRKWPETRQALANMVQAAEQARQTIGQGTLV